jgi:hypothetical protein
MMNRVFILAGALMLLAALTTPGPDPVNGWWTHLILGGVGAMLLIGGWHELDKQRREEKR